MGLTLAGSKHHKGDDILRKGLHCLCTNLLRGAKRCVLHVCLSMKDNVVAGSPASDCSLLDSDRDTTFDDFDLENDERLEVTEMFHGSSDRDLSRSHSLDQGRRRRSESEADWTGISIPTSCRLGLLLLCF